MQSINIKKSKYIFLFVLFVLILLLTDQIFYSVASINDQLIFGLFGNNILAILISIFLLAIILFQIAMNDPKYYFAFAVLSAGVFSNIIERIFFGGVIDYINILFIPSFNVSDVLIVFSLILIFWLKLVQLDKKISQ